MKIVRRSFLALALAGLAMPAQARELSLDEISAYLNGIVTAKANFVQVNDDGSKSVGRLTLRRPGRVRFDYTAPDDSLVIAGQGVVAVFDARSNDRPQKFQLANTPLSLILGSDIDFARDRMVVGQRYVGRETMVVAQDPAHPEYGALQLYFTDEPRLTRWVLIDGSGAKTIVELSNLETGIPVSSRLFDVDAELASRGF